MCWREADDGAVVAGVEVEDGEGARKRGEGVVGELCCEGAGEAAEGCEEESVEEEEEEERKEDVEEAVLEMVDCLHYGEGELSW